MAQVSSVDSDFSSVDLGIEERRIRNPGDQTEETKKSFLSKVKDKAKGTVRKLRQKPKKDSDEWEYQTSSGLDDDWESSETPSQSHRGSTDISPSGGVREDPDQSRSRGSSQEDFGGKSEHLLSSFARSDYSENSPLVAVPTNYGDPHSMFEDVMPPSIINPTSPSEQGEQSSIFLGEIPEAKEEEKAAVAEVQEGGPDSDISDGFKKNFNQRDLQAIDGLPKPRGFDVNDESSVKSYVSNDSGRFQESLSFDGEEGPNGNGVEPSETTKGRSHGTVHFQGIEENNARSHAPGPIIDKYDSMFSSNVTDGMGPDTPPVVEANPGSRAATVLSRGLEPDKIQSGARRDDDAQTQHRHPPAPRAEMSESDLTLPSAAGLNVEPGLGQSTSGGANVPVGDISRGAAERLPLQSEVPSDLNSSGLAGETTEDHPRGALDMSSEGKDTVGHTAGDERAETDEEKAEDFFDAVSDEGIFACKEGLDSNADGFNLDAAGEYDEQRILKGLDSYNLSSGLSTIPYQVAASSNSSPGAAESEPEYGGVGEREILEEEESQSASTLPPALGSLVDSVVSMVNYYRAPDKSTSPGGGEASASKLTTASTANVGEVEAGSSSMPEKASNW